MNSAFQRLEYYFLKLQHKSANLHTDILFLLQGEITHTMLPPDTLSSALLGIRNLLPPGISLPLDPTRDPFRYYQLMRSSVYTSDNGFVALISISLADASSTLNVYSVKNMPIFSAIEHPTQLMGKYHVPDTMLFPATKQE